MVSNCCLFVVVVSFCYDTPFFGLRLRLPLCWNYTVWTNIGLPESRFRRVCESWVGDLLCGPDFDMT